LPGEAAEFIRIDQIWKQMMEDLQGDTLVLHIENIPSLLENLSHSSLVLETI
jgi:hypothetical protein